MTALDALDGNDATSPRARPDFVVPLIERGHVVVDDEPVAFGARGRGVFHAPSPSRHFGRLALRSPGDLADLHAVPIAEIVDVLVELGNNLSPRNNGHVQEAMAAAAIANEYPESMLRQSYAALPFSFSAEALWEMVDTSIGREYLDGWVARTHYDGREIRTRAFGARCVHIPAGNGALVAAITIIRSAITKGDGIIKAPSNDPLTAAALCRTLIDIAPDHPLTRHLTVVYWKGGDAAVEGHLYDPRRVEKIVAWGGVAALRHVGTYIQPGLELIALDPKRSATFIGREAFANRDALADVARRLALDVGVANQYACANARVAYVASGTGPDGVADLVALGRHIAAELHALPPHISTPVRHVDHGLRDNIDALRLADDWYTVLDVAAHDPAGPRGGGAVIVSHLPEPVDFADSLAGRVLNLVPVDDPLDALGRVNGFTQTIGVYPDSLKQTLRDIAPLYGAQRLTSLGYACHVNAAMPQDAIEPVRRMCKWIVDDHCDPASVIMLGDVPELAL
jgi:hypothetical protein